MVYQLSPSLNIDNWKSADSEYVDKSQTGAVCLLIYVVDCYHFSGTAPDAAPLFERGECETQFLRSYQTILPYHIIFRRE
jgi:hypothetical protein